MKTISESKSSQRAISVIWGVLLTAVLMFGLALALVYAYRLALEVLSWRPLPGETGPHRRSC